MSSEDTEVRFDRALEALRRRAWLIVLCVVAVGGAAFAYSSRQQKQYTATAALVFQSSTVDQEASGLPAAPTSETQLDAATNIQLVKLGSVAARTASSVGLGFTTGVVQSTVSVSASGTSNVANVSATLPNPATAALVANTYAGLFVSSRKAAQRANVDAGLRLVEQQLAGMSQRQRTSLQGQDLVQRAESLKVLAALQTGDVSVAQHATAPTSPSSPKTKENTALGIALGLLIGLGVVFLLERLDHRIRDTEELEAAFGTRILTSVPESPAIGMVQGLEAGIEPILLPPEAEAFRLLRAHLRYFDVDRQVPLTALQITSVGPGDGKSTISRNLAETAASMGTKTLLVEADMRRPGIARQFGLRPDIGLAQVLAGSVDALDAVRSVPIVGRQGEEVLPAALDVLLAGDLPPNPAELSESAAMFNLLEWARTYYEFVVIDAPPPLVVSDAVSLLAAVDGVLIVSRIGRTTRDQAKRLREDLERIQAPVLGLIANGITRREGAYGDYYSYGPGDALGRRGQRRFRRSRGRKVRRTATLAQEAVPSSSYPISEHANGHRDVNAGTTKPWS